MDDAPQVSKSLTKTLNVTPKEKITYSFKWHENICTKQGSHLSFISSGAIVLYYVCALICCGSRRSFQRENMAPKANDYSEYEMNIDEKRRGHSERRNSKQEIKLCQRTDCMKWNKLSAPVRLIWTDSKQRPSFLFSASSR